MTVTIDLTAAEEARLAAAARQEGIAPEKVLKKLLNTLPASPEHDLTMTAHQQARIAAIQAARGSMAHIGVTVDDLHRERQADKQAEEQQWPRRLP